MTTATAAAKPETKTEPKPESRLDPQAALAREVATFKYVGGLALSAEEDKLADRSVAPRVVNTELGRLLVVAHVRALEIALHGAARTPLPTGNHA